jgi:hypothetical protein
MGRRRVLVIAAVVLLAVSVVAVIALPEIVRRVVIWRVASLTGRPVTLAALELSLVGGRLALRDLRVMDHDQGPLATIQALQVRFSPRDLLRGHVRVMDGTLQAPTVRIVRTGPSEFNISDLLGRPSEGGMAVAVTLERFALRGGVVTLEDRTLASPRAWRVEPLTLDATSVSTLPAAPAGVVTLSAVGAGAPISVWVAGVRLSPLRFHATVIAREIDGSLAALYLPPDSPLSPTRAMLDATATVEQDAGGTRAALDAVFSGVELRGPGQAGATVSAPAIRVTVRDLRVGPGGIELGELTVDGGRLALEDARLAPVRRWQAEGIAVEARNLSSARAAPAGVGRARAVVAGSPVAVWVAGLRLAPLELNATAIIRNVDFALFRIYVPPELPVQPERGVVNATVRIEHDARRGTRLALDAGLTSVELRRPAHFVTAPSLRVTAEDITFGAGVVTVGRAALAGDRLTLEDRTLRPPRTWPVQSLVVEARRLSSRREDVQGVASARATIAGAAASAWVTHVRLAPLELNLTAILRDLDLRLVQLYLPLEPPVLIERGVANASVQLAHDAAGGTRLAGDVTLTGVQARGRGVAEGLALSAPSLRVALADGRWHESTLGIGRLEATGSGLVTDSRIAAGRLDVERLRLAAESLTWPVRGPAPVALSARLRDGGELEADGTVLLTAPPPMVAWTSELSLGLKDLPVAPVAAYVPAASGLAGRVSARVTATAAYGAGLAARVRGEATVARLALAEGGRSLVAVRGLEATGLDVQWPEQITVDRLRLDRPRALIERDRQGILTLAARFAPPPPAETAPPASAETAPSGASAAPDVPRSRLPAIAAGEIVVERGRLVFVDARDRASVRLEVPRVDFTLRDARWPGSAPAQLRLDAALPEGGTIRVEGTLSAEPKTVDVNVVLADASLAPLQPHLPFRARVNGRLDATLAVAGPLAPAPRLAVRGDATVRSAALADGPQPVITVERLSARGIDATLPSRFTAEQIRVRRSWALIERDREGRFNLEALLRRMPGAPSARQEPPAAESPATVPETPQLELRVGEGSVEEGAATIVDGVTTPAARFEIAGARLAVQDLEWPSRRPVRLQMSSPTPTGGRLDVDGTLELEPVRMDLRAKLEGVELAPGQPYLPIAARVAGRMTGDLRVKLALEPLSVQVAGQAQLQGFRLADGERPLITAGRAEAVGIDVDWPRRVALQRLLLRRPRLLIERNPAGEVTLPRLLTPYRSGPAPASAPPETLPAGAPSASAPTIEIGQVTLERGSGRFVDQTFAPSYAEELSRVDLTVTDLTTAAGRRAHFSGGGMLGGGGSFRLEGDAAQEERPVVDLKIDVKDFALPRGNPYLARYTGWEATRGSLTASASYALRGSRLDARHDVVVRALEVERSGGNDEVEQRLGLPLGFLVSLLKDARGEIRLSVPVSGDLSTREFDFQDAVWSGIRALSFRLLALPFSRVGSLAFSEDSKVEAVTLAPVLVDPGTAQLAPGMTDHLDRIAAFLRGAPALRIRLAPILVQADLDALRGQRPVADPLPEDAMKELGARRLETVRQALTSRGVEGARLSGSARRVALVEAAGAPRVELDLRP